MVVSIRNGNARMKKDRWLCWVKIRIERVTRETKFKETSLNRVVVGKRRRVEEDVDEIQVEP